MPQSLAKETKGSDSVSHDDVRPSGAIHPAAELFPMIDADEMDALVDDIKANGLKEAGWLMPDGALLDGRHRMAACERAGVPMRWRVYRGDDPIAHVLSYNLRHRHLNTGQRAMLALQIEPLYAELARQNTGGRPRLVEKPVADRPQVSEFEAAPKPKPAAEKKSREQAAKTAGTSGRAVGRAKRVAEKAPDLADKVVAGQIALDAAEKELRVRQAKESYLARQAEWDRRANSAGDRWRVLHGDFRDMLADLEDGSVDAIVTDPPYPDEFLPLWADLAQHAERVLRPGAPLIAWSGQYRLREVLNHLCGPLRYQWTLCLDLPGTNARFRGTNMIQTWKPIIVCTAGAWGPHDWYRDRVVSPGKDQALYEWQQNPDPAAELIRRYVPEGGLVLDPFTGVGSFGVAALATGRRFVGVEIDAERHMTACQRLTEVAQ